MKRTKAIEILDADKCSYELKEFVATDFTAEEVAVKLGIPIHTVFKTLVVRGDRTGEAMAVVPGDKELSLKKLAAATGDKKIEMVKIDELQKLTGYMKGGVSPLGSKKRLPVFIDSSATSIESISVSAGLRGLQIIVKPTELARLAEAKFCNLV